MGAGKDNGNFTFTGLTLNAGTWLITAKDTTTSNPSASITITVPAIQTTTTVASSVNALVANQPVTFTATVAAQTPGAGTPSGTVQFSYTPSGGSLTLLGGPATLVNGVATSPSISNLPLNMSISVSAVYGGNAAYLPSNGILQAFQQATAVNTAGLTSNPSGVAVDTAGDQFISNWGNNQIVKVLAGGGASTLPITGATLSLALGMAVNNTTRQLYIASFSNNQIVAVSTNGGAASIVNTGSFKLSNPTDVAVDAQGDLFIADYGNHRVLEVNAAGSVSIVATPGFALSSPWGVAVDTQGNLFISDFGTNRVVRVTPVGGLGGNYGTGDTATSVISLFQPAGLAVDQQGNLFIANFGNNQVVEVNAAGIPSIIPPPTNLSPKSLNGPDTVAVDAQDNLYITDIGNNRVVEMNPGLVVNKDPTTTLVTSLPPNPTSATLVTYTATVSAPYITAPTGTVTFYDGTTKLPNGGGGASNPATLSTPTGSITATNPSGGSSGPVVINTSSTTGLANGDQVTVAGASDANANGTWTISNLTANSFILNGTSTTNTGGVAGTWALVDAMAATYTPSSLPTGVHNITAVYSGDSNDAPSTGYLQVFQNAVLVTPFTGPAVPKSPSGVAVDALGNLFISNWNSTSNNTITEVNTGTFSPTAGGYQLSLPLGMAVDSKGNLFIADYGNNRIVEVTPAGGVGGNYATGTASVVNTPGFATFQSHGCGGRCPGRLVHRRLRQPPGRGGNPRGRGGGRQLRHRGHCHCRRHSRLRACQPLGRGGRYPGHPVHL